MFKNIIPTSQKTHSVFITKTNLLMLLKEIIDFYFENNIQRILRIKADGRPIYNNH
jgi:hypothetical protein